MCRSFIVGPRLRQALTGARFAVAGLGLLAVACGPLPRPFAPESSDPTNLLLMLPDRVGVTVLRVPDLQPKAAGALAEAVANALRRADVVASTRGGNAASYEIDGHIDRDGNVRALVLELVQPGGTVAARHSAIIPGTDAEIARDGRSEERRVGKECRL